MSEIDITQLILVLLFTQTIGSIVNFFIYFFLIRHLERLFGVKKR